MGATREDGRESGVAVSDSSDLVVVQAEFFIDRVDIENADPRNGNPGAARVQFCSPFGNIFDRNFSISLAPTEARKLCLADFASPALARLEIRCPSRPKGEKLGEGTLYRRQALAVPGHACRPPSLAVKGVAIVSGDVWECDLCGSVFECRYSNDSLEWGCTKRKTRSR